MYRRRRVKRPIKGEEGARENQNEKRERDSGAKKKIV